MPCLRDIRLWSNWLPSEGEKTSHQPSSGIFKLDIWGFHSSAVYHVVLQMLWPARIKQANKYSVQVYGTAACC